jgi:drug/metabolite transporter (DMT)-like permease
LTFRRYLVLAGMVTCSALGDVCLSRGMKSVGAIQVSHLLSLIGAIFTPWVILGILFLLAFFASYSATLSWADLTYAAPATALSYVLIAILSRFFLHENVVLTRWIGILLVTLGVGVVARGPSLTKRAHPAEPELSTAAGRSGSQ